MGVTVSETLTFSHVQGRSEAVQCVSPEVKDVLLSVSSLVRFLSKTCSYLKLSLPGERFKREKDRGQDAGGESSPCRIGVQTHATGGKVCN